MTYDEQHNHRFGGAVPPATTRTSTESWQSPASFTEPGLRIIAHAHVEAYAHRCDHVGTEHVLLALIGAEDAVVNEMLSRAGLGIKDIRARIEAAIGPPQQPRAAHLPYSPDAKRAFAASADEAQREGDRPIDVADILYGILSQQTCAAARLVADLGADPESICNQALPRTQGGSAESSVRKSKAV